MQEGGYERHLLYFMILRSNCFSIVISFLIKYRGLNNKFSDYIVYRIYYRVSQKKKLLRIFKKERTIISKLFFNSKNCCISTSFKKKRISILSHMYSKKVTGSSIFAKLLVRKSTSLYKVFLFKFFFGQAVLQKFTRL